jgi:nucleolin
MVFPRYYDSNRSKGYAHIIFDSEKSKEKALKLNKSYMGTRYIYVENINE